MKYIIKGRPYTGKDYVVREYDTIEQVNNYLVKEGCTVPCDYFRAGLVVYENGKMVSCWTTPHAVEVLDW